MTNQATRPEPQRRRKAAANAARKDFPIMIRMDQAEKALVDAAARREDAKVGTWARQQLLKLARGWKLAPPGAKIVPSEDS